MHVPRAEDLHVRDADVGDDDDVRPGDPHRTVTSPARRAPSSATITSASGGAPRSVTGSPISLLNDAGLACARNLVADDGRRHVLRRGLPVRPGDRHDGSVEAPTFVRRESQQRVRGRSHLDLRGRTVGGVPDEDRGGAAGEGLVDEAMPVGPFSLERDEQGSRTRPPASRSSPRRRRRRPRSAHPRRRPRRERGRGFTAPLRSEPSSSRAIDRSSNGTTVPAGLLVRLVTLARDHHDVARLRLPHGEPDRAPVGRARRRSAPARVRPRDDLPDDRERVFGSRVVAGDHAEVRGRRGRLAPWRDASRGRGRHHNRTRRSRGRRPASVRPGARPGCYPACARSPPPRGSLVRHRSSPSGRGHRAPPRARPRPPPAGSPPPGPRPSPRGSSRR